MIQGIHSVLDTVMKWALNAKCTEVVVLDGIAIQGMFEGKREPMILSSDGQVADKANLLHDEEYNNNKHSFFNTAFIGGTAGGTLIVMLIQWHCMQSTAHSSN
jgi:predicted ATP-grasp superfamily ATP-dependent carboligase